MLPARFSPNRLAVRLLVGFLWLILLTTLSTAVPALWLTHNQLEHQAWLRVDTAATATTALLEAEQARLLNQLVLFTERPTLERLIRTEDWAELLPYVQAFQRQIQVDWLLVCDAEGGVLAGDAALTLCPDVAEGAGYGVWAGEPGFVAALPVVDELTGEVLATAVAGFAFTPAFLQQLDHATNARHTIYPPDQHPLLSPNLRQTIQHDQSTYYASYTPLGVDPTDPALLAEIAINTDELTTNTQNTLFILATSTLLVLFFGSLATIWFIHQLNAPLKQLTRTAQQISHGDFFAPIPNITTPQEIHTLATALHKSQQRMLHAMQEQTQAHARLDALLQAIVEGVVAYNTAGEITFWSSGAHHLLGWSASEAIGQPINQLFQLTPTNPDPFLHHIPASGENIQLSIRHRHHNQPPLLLALTSAPLTTASPDPDQERQTVLVFRDVTEEMALARLRSYFLSSISHEFRTPLSTLTASMELLLNEAEQFTLDEVRQLLKPSHISLLTLQTLIDNLLESGSIEANRFRLRLRPLHIHEALENALNIARPLLERRQQPLAITEPPHLPLMTGDPARLTQLLLNLLVNASKYSDIGQPLEVRLAQAGDWLRVEVADRGPGIPPEERERLFDSFVRLGGNQPEPYGVGLGLFVVKTIATAHGGRVGVHGRVGGGSLFWLELPLVPPQEQEEVQL